MARDRLPGVTADLGDRWTPIEAAEFAARRDFRLLQLLSKDRRATTTAKHLGLFTAKRAWQGSRRAQQRPQPATPQRRASQMQTVRDAADDGGAALNARQRRNRRRAQNYTPKHLRGSIEEMPMLAETDSAVETMSAEVQAMVQAMRAEVQLAEASESAAQDRRAGAHWQFQYDKLQAMQPMDDEGGATKRPRSPTASVGTSNGDGARTPPRKNAISSNDVVRAEKAVLEAASEALAAKGKGAGKGRGGGRS